MKPLLPLLAAAAAIPAFAPAAAQTRGNERVNQLIVYGNDPCPRGQGDDIVVCARRPEGDRFRIPSNLRDDPNDPNNQSWARDAQALEYVGRTGTDSCTPVGSGGWTGCLARMIREARADRDHNDSTDWNALIDQARQQRLSHIDADAAVEDAQQPPMSLPQQPAPPPAPVPVTPQ